MEWSSGKTPVVYQHAARIASPRTWREDSPGGSPESFLDASYFLWTRKEVTMSSRIANAVVRFLIHEDGPTAVEYAVMLALIIVVCIFAITALGTNANATFTTVGTAIGSTAS
jgi:pilus assembly protein Flp/PilA